MKRAIALGTIALIVSACSPGKASQAGDAAVRPVIDEVFTASKTVDGASLKYPEGKAEMRLYRVEIPVGGKIPLHKHPAPMMVYVQGVNSGSLRNTRVMSDGKEIETVFKPGEAFLKELIYLTTVKILKISRLFWVTVTSVEGLPTTIFLD